MASDKLLLSAPADRTAPAICVTRSLTFRHGETRFALDADLLRQDGYHAKPVCEVGGIVVRSGSKTKTAIKSNIELFRRGIRGVRHNVAGLPHKFKLEYEYEERFYEPIENLGMYVVYIDLLNNQTRPVVNTHLETYLQTYPHIQLRAEGNKHYKLYDIDYGQVASEIELTTIAAKSLV